MHHMDDAFTLIRQAVNLLPEDATAENGVTVGDVREYIAHQEWEMALGILIEIGDSCPACVEFWDLLAEAARQMTLDRSRRWCEWRGWEVQHGTVRVTLSLLGPEEGGRRSAFSGDGRLRPLWDIGHRTPGGTDDAKAFDSVIRGVHGVAERANALLKVTFKALRRVSLDPKAITRITRAALVLLQMEHGRTS
ncbi:hypothetical protein [Streptomyces brevispora]|uniref:hypothetical protein n=1 Tax=Streptomyces brevispora TaxID=887462 RepID=UPI003F4D1D47